MDQAGSGSWYVSHAGRVLGPVELPVLMARIDAGTVRAADQVARPGDAKWRPAARVFPARFPGPGRRPVALVTGLLALFALGCWAAFGAMTLAHERVADPGLAGALGLAMMAGCAALLLLAAAAVVWLRSRGGGLLGTGVKVLAVVCVLAALPAMALGFMVFQNTLASDIGVDAHHLSVDEHGEVWLVGGVGRTLAHDLGGVLADHAGDLVLVLDNGGGIIEAAEAAVDLLRQRGPFTVRVEGECASACALLLAAADRIELYSDSRIGLHRPSSVLGGELASDYDDAIKTFVEHLSRAGFGPRALAAVRDVPSEDMLWLQPATHFGVLPAFHLLDDDGQEVDADVGHVVLARELLARDTPEAGEMLDLVHAAFPGHAREHSHALLVAHGQQQGIEAARGELLHAPFGVALAASTPATARAWLANVVKLDEQFEWASPAGACYAHDQHEKARRAAFSRANEVLRASSVPAPAVEPAPASAGRRWPLAYAADHPQAARECRQLIATARALAALPDAELMGALAERLH